MRQWHCVQGRLPTLTESLSLRSYASSWSLRVVASSGFTREREGDRENNFSILHLCLPGTTCPAVRTLLLGVGSEATMLSSGDNREREREREPPLLCSNYHLILHLFLSGSTWPAAARCGGGSATAAATTYHFKIQNITTPGLPKSTSIFDNSTPPLRSPPPPPPA